MAAYSTFAEDLLFVEREEKKSKSIRCSICLSIAPEADRFVAAKLGRNMLENIGLSNREKELRKRTLIGSPKFRRRLHLLIVDLQWWKGLLEAKGDPIPLV